VSAVAPAFSMRVAYLHGRQRGVPFEDRHRSRRRVRVHGDRLARHRERAGGGVDRGHGAFDFGDDAHLRRDELAVMLDLDVLAQFQFHVLHGAVVQFLAGGDGGIVDAHAVHDHAAEARHRAGDRRDAGRDGRRCRCRGDRCGRSAAAATTATAAGGQDGSGHGREHEVRGDLGPLQHGTSPVDVENRIRL
jgi:hypothetical protein